MKGVPGVMVLLSHVSLLSAFGTLMPCAMAFQLPSAIAQHSSDFCSDWLTVFAALQAALVIMLMR